MADRERWEEEWHVWTEASQDREGRMASEMEEGVVFM